MSYHHDKNYTPEEQKIREEILNKKKSSFEVLNVQGEWRKLDDGTEYLVQYATIKDKNGTISEVIHIGDRIGHLPGCKHDLDYPVTFISSSCRCSRETYKERRYKHKGRWSKD